MRTSGFIPGTFRSGPAECAAPGRGLEWGKYIQGPLHSLSKTLAHGAADRLRAFRRAVLRVLVGHGDAWLVSAVVAFLGVPWWGSVLPWRGPWGP